jgi:hypothetical protein
MAKKNELVHGMKAKSPKGFAQNIKVMEKAGYSKKRAVGTAYGEADRGMMSLEQLYRDIKDH